MNTSRCARCVCLLIVTCLTVIAYAFPSIRKDYADALAAYREKDLYTAVPLLETLTKKNPYYLEPGLLLAECYVDLENYTKAEIVLNNLKLFHPENPGVYEREIRLRLAQEAYEDVKLVVDDLLARNSKSDVAYYALGKIDEVNGYAERAIKKYKKALRYNKASLPANVDLGYLYLFNGKKEMARPYFETLSRMHPRNERAYYHFANYLYKTGAYDKALVEIEKALHYYPDYIDAQKLKASIYEKRGEYGRAITILKQIPDRHLVGDKNYLLAYLYEQQGDLENALFSYEAYLRDHPDEVFARIAYERVLFALAGTDSPRRKNASFYYLPFGERYQKENDYRRALLYYKRAMRLNPTDTGLRKRLAKLYKDEGLFEKYYEQMLIVNEIDPGDEKLRTILQYKARDIKALPSRKKGIKQYDAPPAGFSVALFDTFTLAKGSYNGIEKSVTETLAHALHQFPLVTVKEYYHNAYSEGDRMRILQTNEIDFVLEGSVLSQNDGMTVKVSLIHAKARSSIAEYTVHKEGKEKLFETAYTLAKKIADAMPLSGKVIEMDRNDIIINVGRVEGVTNNMRFDVFRTRYPLFDFVKKRPMLPKDTRIGTIRIREADETVSIAEVEKPSTFSFIRKNFVVAPYVDTNKQAEEN